MLTVANGAESKAAIKTPTIKIETRTIAAITIGSFFKGVGGAGGSAGG
jgi:hypothetical protein